MPVWARAALFIVVVPGTVAGWLPWRIAGEPSLQLGDSSTIVRVFGGLLTGVGWTALLWCAADFARRGRGTPAPYDAPRLLVSAGLYRVTRNPMYVAVLTAIVGEALWYESRAVAAYAVLVGLCFHVMVVLYEEPRLTREFGASYLEYRARVPRWITFRMRRLKRTGARDLHP